MQPTFWRNCSSVKNSENYLSSEKSSGNAGLKLASSSTIFADENSKSVRLFVHKYSSKYLRRQLCALVCQGHPNQTPEPIQEQCVYLCLFYQCITRLDWYSTLWPRLERVLINLSYTTLWTGRYTIHSIYLILYLLSFLSISELSLFDISIIWSSWHN